MTRFGKADGYLCLHFTPTFFYDWDESLCGPCRASETVTQRGRLPSHTCRTGLRHFEETPRAMSHPQDPHICCVHSCVL